MADLDSAINPPGDLSSFSPVDPDVQTKPAAPIADDAPGPNPYLRCAMPGVFGQPDGLRQFYRGPAIPQARVIPPSAPTIVPVQNTVVESTTITTTEVQASTTPDLLEIAAFAPAVPTPDTQGIALMMSLLFGGGGSGIQSFTVIVDTLANIPASASTGTLFYATDNYTLYIYNAAWITVGGAIWKATVDSVLAAQFQTSGGTPVVAVDTTNSRVAIGTTAPDQKLHVNGSIAFAGAGGANRQQLGSAALTGTRSITAPDADSVTVIPKGAVANSFLTALSAGGVLSAVQPAASDLTNGTTGTGAVVLQSVTDALAGQFGSIAGATIPLAKITGLGADGSITVNNFGCVTGYVAPT